jgi:hypothetical protein
MSAPNTPPASNDFVLVPREPTEAMLRGGAAAQNDFTSKKGLYPRTQAVWHAMLASAALAAAPASPEPASNEAPGRGGVWQPIETAPKDGLRTIGSYLIASIRQPRDEDGEPDGEPEIAWAHVAYLTASGWMVPTQGFKGVHGYASFPLLGATHWMPLPAAPSSARRS